MASATVEALLGAPPAVSAGRRAERADRSASWRRQLAVYVAHTGLGVSQHKLARLSGLARQVLSRSIRRMEDRREDPGLDELLALLERESWRRMERGR